MRPNDCVSVTWAINNFSYCWQEYGEAIVSPTFCICMPKETKWNLMLFPRGNSVPECVSLFLYRDKDCKGSKIIEVEYILQILRTDGSIYGVQAKRDRFKKDSFHGWTCYDDSKNVFNRSGMKYLSQDILTVHCEFIRFERKIPNICQTFYRTIIRIKKYNFQWPTNNFSNFAPEEGQSFVMKSESKAVTIQFNLLLISDNNEESICLDITSFDHFRNFSFLKTFIIDSQNRYIDSGEFELRFHNGKCDILQLSFTKRQLMAKESLYLPNDVLTLSFELTTSTGFAFEGIEKDDCYLSSSSLTLNEETENWRKCIAHKTVYDCPFALIPELTSLQEDQSTSDMELQTKTGTFPVHTSILSARSSVFKAMFSSEMKMKANRAVDVSDFEDEIIRRFLLYLYTDQLEDLKWEDAFQLYRAADKYAVISLKEKCSSFLKSNFNPENACEALVLSDLHHNKDLKSISQNFILENANVIFKSEDWKSFADANCELALETMLLNFSKD